MDEAHYLTLKARTDKDSKVYEAAYERLKLTVEYVEAFDAHIELLLESHVSARARNKLSIVIQLRLAVQDEAEKAQKSTLESEASLTLQTRKGKGRT